MFDVAWWKGPLLDHFLLFDVRLSERRESHHWHGGACRGTDRSRLGDAGGWGAVCGIRISGWVAHGWAPTPARALPRPLMRSAAGSR